MRSELVFKAVQHEPNRYLLVRLLAKGTRKLHRPNTRLQDTTNEVLERFPVRRPVSESVSESWIAEPARTEHRRAA